MRERALVLVATLAAWGVCEGASAEVVELAVLEQRALARHADLEASALRERAAAAEVRQAESGYRPRIGLTVDSNLAPGRQVIRVRDDADADDDTLYSVQGVNAFSDRDIKNVFVPTWRSSANVTVGANLYDFGRTAAAIAASRAKRAAAASEREIARAHVVGYVRAAYLGWLSAHELHRLSATASVDGARRSERVAALVQEGARPRGDLAPVEADRLLSELELERAAGELAGARLLLEQTVGEPLSASAEPDLRVLELTPEAPSHRPDPALQALAHQGAALAATARLQRRQRAPILSGSVGAGVGGQIATTSKNWFPSYAAGLAMTVPLWDGGEASATAEAIEARAEELRLQLESTERARAGELERARLDAEHAQRREQTAQKLLDVCRTRVADAEAGYELGAMQFEQVQSARALLRRAETELVMAKVARAEAALRVAP